MTGGRDVFLLSACHPVKPSSRPSAPFAPALRMTASVLFGGRTDERHVSVASAQNIARALAPPPLCWFWTPEGAVHDVALAELLAHQRPFEIDFRSSRPALWPT